MEHSTVCLYTLLWGLWGLLPVLNWLQYHFNMHSLNPLCREEDLGYPFFLNISASWTSSASSLLPIKMSSLFLPYKPHSNAMFWNNKHLLSHTPTCVGQESGSALSAWFWLRVSRKVAVTVCAKVAVIEAVSAAKGFTPKQLTNMPVSQCQPLAGVVCSSPHGHLLRAALSIFMTWLLTSCKLGHLREHAKNNHSHLVIRPWKSCLLCNVLMNETPKTA